MGVASYSPVDTKVCVAWGLCFAAPGIVRGVALVRPETLREVMCRTFALEPQVWSEVLRGDGHGP